MPKILCQVNYCQRYMWLSVTFLFPIKMSSFEVLASLVAQLVKNPPVMQETACNAGDTGLISRLERSPKKETATQLQCSLLGNLWTEELGGQEFTGSQRAGHNLATKPPPQQK